jgi:hypothetical protein
MKFMSIVYDSLKLIRSFPQCSLDGTLKLIELIKIFNSISCNLILGGGAYI